MANNAAHNALVRDALEQLAINGYTAYENETGVWFDYSVVSGKLVRGRPHAYGKKGSGDIILILPPHGLHVEAEAKTGTGRQSGNQNIHQEHVVERNGGIYILFRNTADLLAELAGVRARIAASIAT